MLTKSKKKAPSLLEVFDLNSEDIAENAAGRLAVPQRKRLRQEQMRYWTGVGTALLLKVLTLLLYGQLLTQDVSSAGLALVIAFAVAMSGFALWSAWKALILQMDIQAGEVAAFEERVFMDVGQRPAGYMLTAHYALHGDGLTFPVEKTAFLAFQNGAAYRVYYSPRSKVLLGAERLHETNISPASRPDSGDDIVAGDYEADDLAAESRRLSAR